jgi:hypothetical protein
MEDPPTDPTDPQYHLAWYFIPSLLVRVKMTEPAWILDTNNSRLSGRIGFPIEGGKLLTERHTENPILLGPDNRPDAFFDESQTVEDFLKSSKLVI